MAARTEPPLRRHVGCDARRRRAELSGKIEVTQGGELDDKGFVRAGSVKRVAAAVGEGAQVVAALHAYLARTCDHVAPAQLAQP